MRAWRFHRSIYHPLDTTGSQTYGGRWNPPGVAVAYASPTFAGGLLELVAHASVPRRPPRDHLASLLEMPDDAGIAGLEPPYPPGWDHPHDFRTARAFTETWLSWGEELCLVVPSVPGSPVERNVIVNARHPRFDEVVVVEQLGPVFDPRIWS